ncbi:hypothetical protein ACQPYH_05475 [Kribbella sp. CA-245084]|uniref:hypothetical protein n=1 Tax=Kribbella sp. CA-245084 TaxID=3239940 RepID=UPI003D8A2A28
MKFIPLEVFGGVSLILVIMIIAGRYFRRPGAPKGPMWQYIGVGFALFVTAGVLYTFPPHTIVAAALVMVLGTGFFTFGIAMLGGGYFGFFGAVASGMAAVPFLMTPTPVALTHVGHTITCHLRGHRGDDEVYGEFTADCPSGRSYNFNKHGSHTFPDGQVQVVVDPHGVLQAEFVGQENAKLDLVTGILGLLGAAGIVVAAAVNRRRRHGVVKHVVNPRYSSGP